jgi:hypothetical protein
VLSLALDVEHAHCASFYATLTNLTNYHESESLGPFYGVIRREVHSVATSTLPWAVQLRASYATISRIGGFSDVDLTVLATTLDQDLSEYVGSDVEFVPSSSAFPVAPAPRMTCLQVPIPDALTRPNGKKGGTSSAKLHALLRLALS